MPLDARIAPSGTGPVDSPTPTQPVVEHAPPVPPPLPPAPVDTGTGLDAVGGAVAGPAPDGGVTHYSPQTADAPVDPHLDSTGNTGWTRLPSGYLLPPVQYPGP